MSTFVVRHFGGLSLSGRCGNILIPAQLPRPLFAFLSTNPDKVFCRNYLSDLLWPDLPAERARRALSTALWRLRKFEFVGNYITQPSRDTISMKLNKQSWVDTLAFENKLLRAQKIANKSEMRALTLAQQAIGIYQGCAFSDISGEWALIERVRLENLYCDVLFLAATLTFKLHRFREAELCARQLVGLEPYREDAHRILILSVHQNGNKAKAKRICEEYTNFLINELDVRPEFTIETLSKDIAGHIAQHPIPLKNIKRDISALRKSLRTLEDDLSKL